MEQHFFIVLLLLISSLLFEVTLTSGAQSAQELENKKSITKNALGQAWTLGDLYDARTDKFCGETIFYKKLSNATKAARTVEIPGSKIKFIHSHDMSAQIQHLDIDASQGLGILLDTFEFSFLGSAKYLADRTDHYKKQVLALVYDITTVDEMLNLFHEDLVGNEVINDPLLMKTNATHVVTGIKYGARLVIKCLFDLKEKINRDKITSAMKDKLSRNSTNTLNEKRFSLKFFGDVLPPDGKLPTTFEEAIDVVQQLPELLSNVNDGKGKALEYRLMPMTVLREIRAKQIKAIVILNQLQNGRMDQIIQLLDKLRKSKFHLEQFYDKVVRNREYVRREDRLDVFNYTRGVQKIETRLKSDITTALVNYRSGGDQNELDDVIARFSQSMANPKTIDRKIEIDWAPINKKIEFGRTITHHGAHFIRARDFAYEYLRGKNYSYALYFKSHEVVEARINRQEWGRNKQLLYGVMRGDKNPNTDNRYVAVDCDIAFADICNSADLTSVVKEFYKGNVTFDDLLAERRKSEDDCGVMLGHLNLWDDVSMDVEDVLWVYDEKDRNKLDDL